MTTSRTQLCYTMEEAAERLNLSETVLVRLSQALKVPPSAYEDVGSLPFKDDPVLTEQEILFFKEVKERLLKGETLEALKRNPPHLKPAQAESSQGKPYATKAKKEPPPPRPVQTTRVNSKPNATNPGRPTTLSAKTEPFPAVSGLSGMSAGQPGIQATNPGHTLKGQPLLQQQPLREVINPAGLHDAAERSFKQYKKKGRLGLRQVFQKILHDLGVGQGKSYDFDDTLPEFGGLSSESLNLSGKPDFGIPTSSTAIPISLPPINTAKTKAGDSHHPEKFNPAQLKEAAAPQKANFLSKPLNQSPEFGGRNPSFVAPPVFDRTMPVTPFAKPGFGGVFGKGSQAIWTGQSQQTEGNEKPGISSNRLNERLKLAASQLKNQALQQAKGW